MNRVVHPEKLDHLAPTDPRAIRSRADLRRIHFGMGNFRWLERSFTQAPESVLEIGAGDGALCHRLQSRFPSARITGVDRVPGPPGIAWQTGDLFDVLPAASAEGLIGVMILHHFSDEALAQLGQWLDRFRELRFCEPWRSPRSQALGWWMQPFFNDVTRHDLPVSVDAGFVPGELAARLSLDDKQWRIEETTDWRGSIRLKASRR